MIELKKTFSKRNVQFTQTYKDEALCLYIVAQNERNSYEVFKPIVRQKDIFHQDEYEHYPSDEEFGKWAWSCSNASHLAKVLFLHFNDHKLTKSLMKYISGTYTRNGENIPYFNLTDDELNREIAVLR